jgi:hypothetical protein
MRTVLASHAAKHFPHKPLPTCEISRIATDVMPLAKNGKSAVRLHFKIMTNAGGRPPLINNLP